MVIEQQQKTFGMNDKLLRNWQKADVTLTVMKKPNHMITSCNV